MGLRGFGAGGLSPAHERTYLCAPQSRHWHQCVAIAYWYDYQIAKRLMRPYLARILQNRSIPRDILLTVVGAVLGLATSHLYYVKSVSDMRTDAEEKNRINQLILIGIENIGSINYVRDGSGTVTGVKIRLHGSGQAQASGSAMPAVTSTDETK